MGKIKSIHYTFDHISNKPDPLHIKYCEGVKDMANQLVEESLTLTIPEGETRNVSGTLNDCTITIEWRNHND